jgi:hypothetical protein
VPRFDNVDQLYKYKTVETKREFVKSLFTLDWLSTLAFYMKWNGVKMRMGKSLIGFVFPPAALTSCKTSPSCRTI